MFDRFCHPTFSISRSYYQSRVGYILSVAPVFDIAKANPLATCGDSDNRFALFHFFSDIFRRTTRDARTTGLSGWFHLIRYCFRVHFIFWGRNPDNYILSVQCKWNWDVRRITNPCKRKSWRNFTDRGPGYWLVLSGSRSCKVAKEIKAYRIHTRSNGSMEGELLCMCQNVNHVHLIFNCAKVE